MIPYEMDKILNMDDVKEKYPQYFYTEFLKRKEARQFYYTELEKLKRYWGTYKSRSELENIARARALYDYLWCIDNITVTMASWGWQPRDIDVLIRRMKAKGYNPWSVTDATGEYLADLKGHGFVEGTRPDGTVFMAYDPAGNKKPRKIKTSEEHEEEKILWEDRDKNPLEVPEEDDYDDK